MKKLIILLFILNSQIAFSQVKHLVFDIDETLVQAVPRSKAASYNSDDIITFDYEGKTNYYHKMPYASSILFALQLNPNIIIHFATNKPASWNNAILSRFYLPKPINRTLYDTVSLADSPHKILNDSNLENGKINLSSITSDMDNILYITGSKVEVIDKYKKNVLSLGANYYYFNNFKEAKDEYDSLKAKGYIDSHKEFLPTSEEEFFLEHNKIAGFFGFLMKYDAIESDDLKSRLYLYNSKSKENLTHYGITFSEYDFEAEAPVWIYSGNYKYVSGCQLFSAKDKKVIKSLPLSQCKNRYKTFTEITFDEANKKVAGCHLKEEAHKAVIEKLSLDDCTINKGDYHWQGKSRDVCAEYINDIYFLRSVSDSLCHNSHIIYENGQFQIKAYYLSNGKLIEGISDIINIKASQVIPASVFSKFDSIMIAQSINEKIYMEREKAYYTATPDYDFKADSNIIMAFDSKFFDSISKSGFLNQHRIGHSNGAYSPSRRAGLEDGFLNFKIESSYNSIGRVAHDVRPKYSYFILTKPRTDMGYTQIYAQYGNVYAKFKNNIKNRSTFTPGDSLNINASGATIKTLNYRSDKILVKSSSYAAYYWEAQIWGELLFKDVEYFLINCPHSSKVDTNFLNKMKATGIPVYQCYTKVSGSHPYLIYAGPKL